MTEVTEDNTVYFWRETDPETGWLSQWYYCPFSDNEDPSRVYHTAEHYMMYQKAMLFGDSDVAEEVLVTSHPRDVKALGRLVKGFVEETWLANRYDIVYKGNMLKFTTALTEEGFCKGTSTSRELPPLTLSLRETLLATEQSQIVEASPYDRIWGIGFAEKGAKRNEKRWGMNLLGKALMDVRTKLKEAKSNT